MILTLICDFLISYFVHSCHITFTELNLGADNNHDSAKSSGSSQNAASDTSDTEREDGCGSPRVQRRKRRRNKSHGGVERGIGVITGTEGEQDDLTYVDTLPEVCEVY